MGGIVAGRAEGGVRDRGLGKAEWLAVGLIGVLTVGLLASASEPRHFVVTDMRLPEEAMRADAGDQRIDLARVVVLAGQGSPGMPGVEICGGFGPGYRLRLDGGV